MKEHGYRHLTAMPRGHDGLKVPEPPSQVVRSQSLLSTRLNSKQSLESSGIQRFLP
ncbi:MAG: hypothetical protein AAGG53_17515 [Cyanobacteria bacterium P01_H01_bin.152]